MKPIHHGSTDNTGWLANWLVTLKLCLIETHSAYFTKIVAKIMPDFASISFFSVAFTSAPASCLRAVCVCGGVCVLIHWLRHGSDSEIMSFTWRGVTRVGRWETWVIWSVLAQSIRKRSWFAHWQCFWFVKFQNVWGNWCLWCCSSELERSTAKSRKNFSIFGFNIKSWIQVLSWS